MYCRLGGEYFAFEDMAGEICRLALNRNEGSNGMRLAI